MAYTLDTAAAAERLVQAGADPELARAIVSTVSQAGETLATKADLANLEIRLIKWGIGIAVASVGILFALLRFTG